MSSYLKDYLEHLAFERRVSPHTVEAYRADLEHFQSWIISKVKTSDYLSLIDHYHLREYLSFCFHQYKNVSIARRLSAIRSFFRFLQKCGQIKSSPADLIENPKIKKPLPKPVTLDEAFAICDLKSNKDKSVRNQAICELLYASGIRISELCALDLDDVDLKQKLVRVMGKGKKERIVPVHDECIRILKQWIFNDRIELVDDPLKETALFIGERGKRIHARVVRESLKKIGAKLGVNQSLHPHRLRHAYATHMLESGADLRGIQELLGHATISTTERYTQIDLASLMKQYDKAHPHSRKKSPKD